MRIVSMCFAVPISVNYYAAATGTFSIDSLESLFSLCVYCFHSNFILSRVDIQNIESHAFPLNPQLNTLGTIFSFL